MEFQVFAASSTKPHTVGDALSPAFDKSRRRAEGSYMFCLDERRIISKLNGDTHDLTLNLFCMDRPQLMLDPYHTAPGVL
jgi:ATP adenylyltransferase